MCRRAALHQQVIAGVRRKSVLDGPAASETAAVGQGIDATKQLETQT